MRGLQFHHDFKWNVSGRDATSLPDKTPPFSLIVVGVLETSAGGHPGEARGGGPGADPEAPAECATDKGYHSPAVLKALDGGPWKTRIAEPKPIRCVMAISRNVAKMAARVVAASPTLAFAITLNVATVACSVSPGETFDAEIDILNAEPFRPIAPLFTLANPPDVTRGSTGTPTRLRISANGRFLENDAGPFFWLGDTAWWMTSRLTRGEIIEYLVDRRAKGFNVVQTVAVPFDKLAKSGNVNGDKPLIDDDFTRPNPTYWDEVEFVIDEAAKRGMYVALLPAWGDHMRSNALNERTGYPFGNWLGRRFATKTNLIWVLGGDQWVTPNDGSDKWNFRARLRRIAEGIADGVNGNSAADGKADYSTTLITYHPGGGGRSDMWLHSMAWLDMNMIQSGHGHSKRRPYLMIPPSYARRPAKPVVDGEPWYEGIPRYGKPKNAPATAADVRRSAYWSVFSGAAGHTYGNASVFQFCDLAPKRCNYGADVVHWRDAMNAPGANQMRHQRSLVESFDMLSRVPDQSLVETPKSGKRHIVATRGDGYALVYVPEGDAFTLRMGKIGGVHVKASWFNPRTGGATVIGRFTNSGARKFVPPGGGFDWVLVLESLQ